MMTVSEATGASCPMTIFRMRKEWSLRLSASRRAAVPDSRDNHRREGYAGSVAFSTMDRSFMKACVAM